MSKQRVALRVKNALPDMPKGFTLYGVEGHFGQCNWDGEAIRIALEKQGIHISRCSVLLGRGYWDVIFEEDIK